MPDDCVVLQRTPPVEFGPADWHRHAGGAAVRRVHQRGFRIRDAGGLQQPRPRLSSTWSSPRMTRSWAVGVTVFSHHRIGLAAARARHPKPVGTEEDTPAATCAASALRTSSFPSGYGTRRRRSSAHSCRRCSRATALARALPRNTIQVSYSTRSKQLAVDVQQMLLEFGVVVEAVSARDGRAQGRHHQPRARGNVRRTSRFRRRQAGEADENPGVPCRQVRGGTTTTSRAWRNSSARTAVVRWADQEWLHKHNVDRIRALAHPWRGDPPAHR